MARSMWKGAISFGLVHIPVEMHTAVNDQALDLTMLDKRDFSPVGFKRYNKGNDKEVVWDDIVKGYEYSDGEYVVLSDEDLRRANPEATGTIDILAFVAADEVPLMYYEQPYYLAPGKGGEKVYALLRDTLKKAGKIGIANVVIRVKQHLAALVCVDDAIILHTLRYADEIRPSDDLNIPGKDSKAATVTDKELAMAMALVEGMADAWKPEQYHDSYREDILALVEKKVKAKQTKTITMPDKDHAAPAKSNVVDLVALLQASIGKKPAAKEEVKAKATPKPAAKAAAKPAAKAASKPSTKPAAKGVEKGAEKGAAKPATSTPARRKKAA